jgi:hypothetical protein
MQPHIIRNYNYENGMKLIPVSHQCPAVNAALLSISEAARQVNFCEVLYKQVLNFSIGDLRQHVTHSKHRDQMSHSHEVLDV